MASTWQRRSCCIWFWSHRPKKCSGDIDSAFCIPLCWLQFPMASHDTIDSGIRWCWGHWHYITKKSCCTSIQLSLHKKCNGAVGIIVIVMPVQWQKTSKSDVALNFNCLNLRNGMVPLTTLHIMPMLGPVIWHDQRIHITPHFDHLYLRNAVVPLMQWQHMTPMLMASCDVNADANDITWKTSSCTSLLY